MSTDGQRKGPRRKSRTAPAQRSRRGSPARSTAHAVLRAVGDGAYANLELPRALRHARLDDRDAAFATELTYGTLRMQGFYDAIIVEATGRPTSRLDGGVLDVLRMGVHQVLAMRVPDHAAADQAVGLARTVAGPGAAGLVNAVMRRVSESTPEEWRQRMAERMQEAGLRVIEVHTSTVSGCSHFACAGFGVICRTGAADGTGPSGKGPPPVKNQAARAQVTPWPHPPWSTSSGR